MRVEGKYIYRFVRDSWELGDLPYDGWYIEGGEKFWGVDGLEIEKDDLYDLADFGMIRPYDTNYDCYSLTFEEGFNRWLDDKIYPPTGKNHRGAIEADGIKFIKSLVYVSSLLGQNVLYVMGGKLWSTVLTWDIHHETGGIVDYSFGGITVGANRITVYESPNCPYYLLKVD